MQISDNLLRGDGANWRLGPKIGEGRYATVFVATSDCGQRAALKWLKSEFAQDEISVLRFLRELSVLREFKHVAFPELFDQGVASDGAPFFVAELLEGQTLEEHRQREGGRLDVSLALSLAEQALDALDYAHKQGFVHRDVNPNNLLVTAAGELKLLDLGLCRAIEMSGMLASITGPGTLGTLGFMAPEQARSVAKRTMNWINGNSSWRSTTQPMYRSLW